MEDLKLLCGKIGLPEEMSGAVLAFSKEFDFGKVQDSMEQLFSRKTWENGLSELKSIWLFSKNCVQTYRSTSKISRWT